MFFLFASIFPAFGKIQNNHHNRHRQRQRSHPNAPAPTWFRLFLEVFQRDDRHLYSGKRHTQKGS
jgi:hypothetical protein